MSRPLYVIQKLAQRTQMGNLWHFFREHPDGSQTLLGFFPKRKEALIVGGLLAGRRGRIEVREKPVKVAA